MTFSPTYVQLQPNGSGSMVDGALVADGSNSVMRQIISIGDPSNAANVSQILNSNPVGTEYGQVVRPVEADGSILQTGTISAVGPLTAVNTNGFDSLLIQITGSWNGLISVEGSSDQSVGSWVQLQFRRLDDLITTDSIIDSSLYVLKCSGLYTRLNVLGLTGSITYSMMGRNTFSDFGTEALTLALDPTTGVNLSVAPGNPGQQLSSKSLPVTLASDQTQDYTCKGPASIFASGINALTGTPAPLDTLALGATSYRSFSVQVNGNIGITAGAITFQGSNDGFNYVSIPVFDQATITGTSIQAAITIAASTYRFFTGKCQFRYLKAAVTTTFTGSWIQCFTRLSVSDITPQVITVGNPTAANMLATVSATNLSTNIAQINGTTPVTAGIAGVLAIGGKDAMGNAATVNPAFVAQDTGALVRAILTDVSGQILNSDAPTTNANAALTSLYVNASGALTNIKASGLTNLYGFSLINNTASTVYFEVFAAATGGVTLGTTTPLSVYIIPASSTVNMITPIAQANSGSGMCYVAVTVYNGTTIASISGSIFYK